MKNHTIASVWNKNHGRTLNTVIRAYFDQWFFSAFSGYIFQCFVFFMNFSICGLKFEIQTKFQGYDIMPVQGVRSFDGLCHFWLFFVNFNNFPIESLIKETTIWGQFSSMQNFRLIFTSGLCGWNINQLDIKLWKIITQIISGCAV